MYPKKRKKLKKKEKTMEIPRANLVVVGLGGELAIPADTGNVLYFWKI